MKGENQGFEIYSFLTSLSLSLFQNIKKIKAYFDFFIIIIRSFTKVD